MKISSKTWKKYRDDQANARDTAAKKMQQYLEEHSWEVDDKAVDCAYGLSTKYGEAAAALACEMYDAIAIAQNANVPQAEPADTPSYKETAKGVYGTLKSGANQIPGYVSRSVKQVGADTMLKNAKRDGAEFAWVPSGDACAFCITLASNGWQRASRKTAEGDHADHIHNNCKCEFVVRFDGESEVEGYDPEEYKQIYDNAEGNNWKEKVNSIRRWDYAENVGKYRSQKSINYIKTKVDDIIKIRKEDDHLLLDAPDAELFMISVQENPMLLGEFTPITFKRALESLQLEVKPLGHGHHKDKFFENGGGYIVHYGGNGAIEYHPSKYSRHGGRYYRLSDSEHGKRWFNTRGQEIDKERTGSRGSQVLK